MKKNVDYKLFFTILSMIVFWMIMISSVSIFSSSEVTQRLVKLAIIDEAYNHFYVLRNIAHVLISLFVLWVVVKIHYSFFEKYAKQIFWGCLFLLLMVFFVWSEYKWARWWIEVPWLPFNIQPTEFAKFWLIIYLAAFFKKFKWNLHTFHSWFLPFLMILWSVFILVALQPDFWTILVTVPLAAIMFFYAGANFKHLLITLWIGMLIAFSVYSAGDYDKESWKNLNKLWYITQRIDNFMADNEEAIKNKTINWQTEQALIAVWSGGFTGMWFWKSIQKYGYLPEVQWDFIFSVIIEELWFLWGLTLLLFYLHIWYRGFYIASRVTDPFGKYVAVGVSTWILLQAFINIWVNLNIVPLTWITLPFISYGWSSLLSLFLALWVLLNISRYVEEKPKFSRNARRKHLF